MRRGFLIIAAGLLIISGIGGARAEHVLLAQYYQYPPPGYGYPPPCRAVTRGPFRGAGGGAARGAIVGGIFGNAGRGAAIGAGIGGLAGAARRGAARSSGYCY